MTMFTFNFNVFGEMQNYAVCAADEQSARAQLLERFRDAEGVVLMQAMTSNLCS